jgi:ribosomal-protein-alanine N-acetyltransferase
MTLTFEPMDEAHARLVLGWTYPPPYELYNENPAVLEADVRALLDAQNHYYCIHDAAGDLLAYCCFGRDAQVGGGDYSAPALDLGLMVRPDLTGQGQGSRYASAMVEFAERTFGRQPMRVTIAEFNQRAQRVWQKAGFRQTQTFPRARDGRRFVVCVREAEEEG